MTFPNFNTAYLCDLHGVQQNAGHPDGILQIKPQTEFGARSIDRFRAG